MLLQKAPFCDYARLDELTDEPCLISKVLDSPIRATLIYAVSVGTTHETSANQQRKDRKEPRSIPRSGISQAQVSDQPRSSTSFRSKLHGSFAIYAQLSNRRGLVPV